MKCSENYIYKALNIPAIPKLNLDLKFANLRIFSHITEKSLLVRLPEIVH